MLLYKSGLKQSLNCVTECVEGFNFSKNTTYGLGGCAVNGYFPKNLLQARYIFDKLSQSTDGFEIIGNGSNILTDDGGINRSVISTKRLKGIVRLNDTKLLCLAGTTVAELLAYCKKHALGGLEFMYGIPATIGGAAYMNAGISGKAIGDKVVLVRAYNGKDLKFTCEICNFGYRRSTMRDINALILSIILNVQPSSAQKIEEEILYYKSRRSHLPKGKSCGCVFKNPENVSAGYLIEAAGLKGFRYGGAIVSPLHANFIINDGGTASDVKAVIEAVKNTVLQKFGILLKEEVVYIGDFNDFNG